MGKLNDLLNVIHDVMLCDPGPSPSEIRKRKDIDKQIESVKNGEKDVITNERNRQKRF